MIAGITVRTYVELERPYVRHVPANGLSPAASIQQRPALIEANRAFVR